MISQADDAMPKDGDDDESMNSKSKIKRALETAFRRVATPRSR